VDGPETMRTVLQTAIGVHQRAAIAHARAAATFDRNGDFAAAERAHRRADAERAKAQAAFVRHAGWEST
jgi:hypothetical protein